MVVASVAGGGSVGGWRHLVNAVQSVLHITVYYAWFIVVVVVVCVVGALISNWYVCTVWAQVTQGGRHADRALAIVGEAGGVARARKVVHLVVASLVDCAKIVWRLLYGFIWRRLLVVVFASVSLVVELTHWTHSMIVHINDARPEVFYESLEIRVGSGGMVGVFATGRAGAGRGAIIVMVMAVVGV